VLGFDIFLNQTKTTNKLKKYSTKHVEFALNKFNNEPEQHTQLQLPGKNKTTNSALKTN
jgi:hypothetical protein